MMHLSIMIYITLHALYILDTPVCSRPCQAKIIVNHKFQNHKSNNKHI